MTERVLVTGAAGFLGSALTATLRRGGVDVIASSRNGGEGMIRSELSDAGDVRTLFTSQRFSSVIHCAATISSEFSVTAELVRNNILATTILANEAKAAGVRNFVFCSSIEVYGGEGPYVEDSDRKPTNAYGWSKAAIEDSLSLIAALDFRVRVLRFSGLHGHGRSSGILHRLITAHMTDMPCSITEPESVFRLCAVDDAVDAIVRTSKHHVDDTYRVFNIGSAEILTLREIACRVGAVLGAHARLFFPERAPVRNRAFSIERATTELGFIPRTMDTVIRSCMTTVGRNNE